jgi:integrase
MPRPRINSSGVIVRDAHLQVDLRVLGFGRERLELAPTPANIAYAHRLRKEMLGKAERGTFSLAEYFPDSPRAKTDTNSMTWKQLGVEWLKIKKGDIEHSTLHHYKQTLGSYHFADWNELMLPQMDFRQLKAKLAALPENGKTFNNIASVMSMVLEYGYKAKLMREPLHESIEMRKPGKPKPDPFTLAEAEVVLSKMSAPKGFTYYEFAFFTGLRPSEQIVLRWADLDLRKGTATVRRAFTRSKEKGTKTGIERTVELNARARAAIERQRSVSQLASDFVFLGMDGQPYTTTDGPLEAWWKPAMKLSGLRRRDARQTRHTYATICLHAMNAPGWVAQQMGNSVEMFYRVYSRWIQGADDGSERRKTDAFLSPKNRDEDRDTKSDLG